MEITAELVDSALVHWPFITALVIFMLVGQVVKTSVFTKTAYTTKKPSWLFWWGRKTLTLHPIVGGVLTGLLWRNPEPRVDSLVESMGYFALSGALSVWAYELIKGLAKKRGIDLELPGVDE